MTGPFSALSREGRREEDAPRLVRLGGTHETCPDREDICVVVLAREPYDIKRAAIEECGARARDAVGGHRLALAAPAEHDAAAPLLCRYTPREREDVVRVIVRGVERVWPEIDGFMARLAHALDESLLQLQTRVVACEINPARIRGIRHWRL